MNAVATLCERGDDSAAHGYQLAKEVTDRTGAKRLTAAGTIYRALDRLEEEKLITGRWDDAPASERYVRRRLYRLTPLGEWARIAGKLPSALDSRPDTDTTPVLQPNPSRP